MYTVRMGTVLLWVACGVAVGGQTSNHVIRAVPAPAKVTIDGRLDEWDTSGGILMCYDTATLLDTHSVRACLMYDSGHLYAAFRFKDRTPMLNRVNPAQKPGFGWQSDCVQLRVWTDADKRIGPGGAWITHIDCYYYTDGKRPTARVLHHDISKGAAGLECQTNEAIGRGVRAAFRTDADGRGYVQEMAIEWEAIRRTGKPYLPGESFRMGLECFWGDGSGFKWYQHRLTDLLNPKLPQREFFWSNHNAWGTVELLAKGHLPPEQQAPTLRVSDQLAAMRYATHGPVAVAYTTPAAGRVTLVVERPDGTRVRSLIANYPRAAGKNVDHWDGTNDRGALVAPGEYRVRGLWHPELDAIYQFAWGNPGQPQWETPDQTGAWMSDLNANAVTSDAQRVYLAGNYHECGVGVIAVDYTGRKLWGLRQPARLYPGIAVHGRYLYMACGSEEHDPAEEDTIILSRLDARTGKVVSFKGERRGFKPLVKVKGLPRGLEKEIGELVAGGGFDASVWRSRVKGLATDGRTVYVPLYWEDEVLQVDAELATVTGRFRVKRPAGVALDGNGGLLVVSAADRQVVRVDLSSGRATVVVKQGLDAPIGLAHDNRGRLYVSDQGKAMCVKVFRPDGTRERVVGKPGGRPWVGRYDRDGMLLPYGVTVDARGWLWVVTIDGSPRRVSVWDAKGALAKEFVDAHFYGGMCMWIDPVEPTRAIAHGAEFQLDWGTGTYRPVGTIWRPAGKGAYFGPGPMARHYQRIDYRGRHLLLAENGGVLVISERKGDRYQPLMAIGDLCSFHSRYSVYGSPVYSGLLNSVPPKLFMERLYWLPELTARAQRLAPKSFSGTYYSPVRPYQTKQLDIFRGVRGAGRARLATTNFVWSDGNDDGRVQQNEVQFFQAPGVEPVRMYWGWQLGVTRGLTLYPSATDYGLLRVWQMPLVGDAKRGAPRYDGAKAKLVFSHKTGHSQGQWADAQGNILSNHDPLTMYTPQGQVRWTYPNPFPGVHASHKATQARAGLMVGPLYVIGSVQVKGVGEVFAFNGNQGQAFLLTTDGLYVGELFRDARSAPDNMPPRARRGQSHRNTTMGSEWFGGQFLRHPRDGKPYVMGEHHTAGGACVYEVAGLDRTRRLPARTIAFGMDQYRDAEKLLAQRAAARQQKKGREVAVQRLKRPAHIDGVGSEYSWAGHRRVRFAFDASHSAEALAACDNTHLYLFYRVRDASPLANRGQQGARYLFKSGDCVLFEVGTTRKPADASTKPARGDLRLILAKAGDRHVAVLYRYVAPEAKQSMVLSTAVRKVRIDQVIELGDARIATKVTPDGYALEAAVPLARLGWVPGKGKSYRADFGVIYGDKQGLTNRLRMNWANKATGIVADPPSEAMIRPDLWGRLVVE